MSEEFKLICPRRTNDE